MKKTKFYEIVTGSEVNGLPLVVRQAVLDHLVEVDLELEQK